MKSTEIASDDQAARVVIEGVSKQFTRAGGATVQAVDDVTLRVRTKDIVVLLGPSGCGKSTLLRTIAGLEDPTAGVIRIGGQTVFDAAAKVRVPPYQRDVNMMFQSYALWPHMTLAQNVAYPLRVKGVAKSRALATAEEYLELVGLQGLGRQYAGSVSGGQAQRAALARTIIAEPAVVLFDEPLSNVDAKVRSRLRRELLRIHAEVGFTALYVTHDQIEAMGVASRIAVMRDGRVLQIAEPHVVYERPSTRYVAEFVGEANFFEGTTEAVEADTLRVRTRLGGLTVKLEEPHPDTPRVVGADVVLMIRPEYCALSPDPGADAPPSDNTYRGRVRSVLYAGSRTEYVCDVDGQDVQVWAFGTGGGLGVGDMVGVRFTPASLRVLGDPAS